MILKEAMQLQEDYRKKHSPPPGWEWENMWMISHVDLDPLTYYCRDLNARCHNMEDFSNCKFYIFFMVIKDDKEYSIQELTNEEISAMNLFTRDDWYPQLPEDEFLEEDK
jgi:hypothetical protein